ncbi:hypothetical protein [uncultured Aeromicrobium sp.]|uniref:hypothetical protein n=1 Tax=uncultured Aeromicrobium sp. TaxID=337820 RepID=UPI0025D4CCC6|nr:hypothetical protein [uncultured Aeromicrobium sp.]
MTITIQQHCPQWCERTHHPEDPPESRFHEQIIVDFPAVVGRRSERSEAPVGVAEELIVRRVRYFDTPQTWLIIEEAEDAARHLILSLDAAASLSAALETVTRDHS